MIDPVILEYNRSLISPCLSVVIVLYINSRCFWWCWCARIRVAFQSADVSLHFLVVPQCFKPSVCANSSASCTYPDFSAISSWVVVILPLSPLLSPAAFVPKSSPNSAPATPLRYHRLIHQWMSLQWEQPIPLLHPCSTLTCTSKSLRPSRRTVLFACNAVCAMSYSSCEISPHQLVGCFKFLFVIKASNPPSTTGPTGQLFWVQLHRQFLVSDQFPVLLFVQRFFCYFWNRSLGFLLLLLLMRFQLIVYLFLLIPLFLSGDHILHFLFELWTVLLTFGVGLVGGSTATGVGFTFVLSFLMLLPYSPFWRPVPIPVISAGCCTQEFFYWIFQTRFVYYFRGIWCCFCYSGE